MNMAVFQYQGRMFTIYLWKFWRVRKHRKWKTLVQIAIPVLLVLLLVAVKAVLDTENGTSNEKPTYFFRHDLKTLVPNLCSIGCNDAEKKAILTYAPNSNQVIKTLMEEAERKLKFHGAKLEIIGLKREEEMEALSSFLRKNESGYLGVPASITGGIVFINNVSLSDGNLMYKIRLRTEKFISGKAFPDVEVPGPGSQYEEYEKTGFLGLQLAIDQSFNALVKLGSGPTSRQLTNDYEVSVMAIPYPPYRGRDKLHYSMVLAKLMPSAIIFGLAYFISTSVATIVSERNSGVKQYLMTMGLGHTFYWFGWYVNLFIVGGVAIFLISLILNTDIGEVGAAFTYSTGSFIYVFLFLYLHSTIWFCFFISILIRSDTRARGIAVMIWLGTFVVPALLIGAQHRYLATQLMLAILPNLCLYWGFNIIATWESRAIGVNWDNLEEYAAANDSLNMASVFGMLIVNGLFYFIVSLSFRHSVGFRRKLKRPFRLMYYILYDDTKYPECIRCLKKGCRKKKNQEEVEEHLREASLDSAVGSLRYKIMDHLKLLRTPEEDKTTAHRNTLVDDKKREEEEVVEDKECGVKIRNLKKQFHSNSILKGFSCDFYYNEVSCILGDSGSGKSLLIDILLGVQKADEGTAYVNDYGIHDYMTEIRGSVSYCPQRNMLFNDLTVMEHLLFFAWLKGKDWSAAYDQALRVAGLLKLKESSKVLCRKLPKEKRKLLCCGLGMMGETKIVFYDNPTDELTKPLDRLFWKFLMKHKEGRTIIFTSSSVAEAVTVSDRIAVLKDGKLRCVGSASFLNTVLGNGYSLTLSVTAPGAESLVRMMCQEVQNIEVKNRTITIDGQDISFMVPYVYVSLFPKLFSQLYDSREKLGILGLVIDSLSFEDVFNSVREMREFKVQGKLPPLKPPGVRIPSKDSTHDEENLSFFVGRRSTGLRLVFQRLWQLMVKNLLLSSLGGDVSMLLLKVVLPLALILIGTNGANKGLRNRDNYRYGHIGVTLSDYNNPITLLDIESVTLLNAFQSVSGIFGAKVLPPNPNPSLEKIHEKLIDVGKTQLAAYRHRYIVAAHERQSHITAMYSTVPLHAPPLSINLVSNAILRTMNKASRIVVENLPLPFGVEYDDETVLNSGNSNPRNQTHKPFSSSTSVLQKSFCFYFAYALSLVCVMVAVKPMRERASGSHRLQLMTGVNPITFWASYLILDLIYIAAFCGMAIFIVFMAQERYLYTGNGGARALFLILFIAGLACCAFAYFLSTIISDSSSGFGLINVLHLIAVLGSFLIYHTSDGINDLLSETFFWVTTPFPVLVLVHSLFVYGKVVVVNNQCEIVAKQFSSVVCNNGSALYKHLPAYACCENCETKYCFRPKNYFNSSHGYESYTLNRDLAILGFSALLYLIIVVLIDYRYFQKVGHCFLSAPSKAFSGDKDSSASQEAAVVTKLVGMGADVPDDVGLLVDGLCKNYGTIGVYSQISFYVRKGECFGLLGLDGSGKSSVFRTLVGENLPSVGSAIIPPYSMLGNRRDFAACIGYCPQTNCIIPTLTATQTLRLYGSLKGICKTDLKTEIQQWLAAVGLERDANLPCRKFTPGMQRRLCVAVALIGNPKCIVLDEPSRDVDPSMKKIVWSTLQKVRKDGKTILVASQDVHECEHLCGKIGLMINGRLQNIGLTREIKRKFLDGYTAQFKLTKRYSVDDTSDIQTVKHIKTSIEEVLIDGIFKEAYQNTLKYFLPEKSQNWGSIVEQLEKIRTDLKDDIEFYSLSESSLEEVFTAIVDMDMGSTNELPETRITFIQRCCMGRCCSDEYS